MKVDRDIEEKTRYHLNNEENYKIMEEINDKCWSISDKVEKSYQMLDDNYKEKYENNKKK